MTFLPRVHAVAGKPGIDAEPAAGAKRAIGLVEETLLVRHMLGAFDGDDAVEGVVLEFVLQPILPHEPKKGRSGLALFRLPELRG